MSKYRKRLAQSHERVFMTDGGLETTLIYHHGIDLPAFAEQYRELRRMLPKLAVVGGCCGTDHRHVNAMCRALGMSGIKTEFDL